MKEIALKTIFSTIISILALLTPLMVVVAQQPIQALSASEEIPTVLNDEKLTMIADVNIISAQILLLDDRMLTFEFNAKNSYLPISDIRYGVDIFGMNADKDGKMIAGEKLYSKVFEESFAIGTGEIVNKVVKLDIPTFISGPVLFKVGLVTKQGLPLAFLLLGDAMIPENATAVITVNNCEVNVVDAKGVKTKYASTFGVDLDATEKLSLVCDAFNSYEQKIETNIKFTTYRRSEYSDKLDTNIQTIAIDPGDTKIDLPIAIQKTPQAYVVFAEIMSSDGSVASQQEFRYVVRGASGTIQNTTMDKLTYNEGDIAEVSLYVTGNADRFPGARAEQETMMTAQAKIVRVTIRDRDSQDICGSSNQVALSGEQAITKIPVEIVKTCPVPQAFVEMSENGTVLDSQAFTPLASTDSLKKDREHEAQLAENTSNQIAQKSNIVIVVIAILLVVISLMIFVARRGNKGTKITKSIVVVLIAGASIFGGANQADAATYSLSFSWYTIATSSGEQAFNYYTITANTSSNKCEQISVSMSSSVGACNNDPIDLTYTLNASGKSKSGEFGCGYGSQTVQVCNNSDSVTNTSVSSGSHKGTWNFSVSAAGDRVHTDFDKANKNYSGSQSVSVAACVKPPVCGSSNNKSYKAKPTAGLCSIGSASSVTGSGPWSWSCASGGQSASCGASKIASPLKATLRANPSSGKEPLATTLIASTSGGSGGAPLYRFKCVAGGPWDTSWQSSNTYSGCTYRGSKTHRAAVMVSRGGEQLPAYANIVTTTASLLPVCGSANGGVFNQEPVTGLCDVGTPNSKWGNGPWVWWCTSGNRSTRCEANKSVVISRCGNRIIEAGEACDDGIGNGDNKACNLNCQKTYCGDGKKQSPNGGGNGQSVKNEECDGQAWCSNCQINQWVAGACGSAQNSAACSAPTANLCNSGTASGAIENKAAQKWEWTCGGTACSTVSYCSYQEQ